MVVPSPQCNGIALAAGAGGLELGLSLALPGHRTVCWVERDAYAAATLVARMEDKTLDDSPVWSDIATFDSLPWRGKVDILTAGYPCQPFSQAGKRLGTNDSRHLWPHVRRILAETESPVLFAENVLGHVSLGLESVWRDLQNMGYEVEAGIFAASEVGASHVRKRLFILAYSSDITIRSLAACIREESPSFVCKEQVPAGYSRFGGDLDDIMADWGKYASCGFPPGPSELGEWESWLENWPRLQPAVAGSDDGLAHKVDRYRLTGNGVCPLVGAYAFVSLVFAAERKIDGGSLSV